MTITTNAKFEIDSTELKVRSFAPPETREDRDRTGLDDDHKVHAAGLRDSECSFEVYLDATTYTFLRGKYLAGTAVTVKYIANRSSAASPSNPEHTGSVIPLSLDWPQSVGEDSWLSVTWPCNGWSVNVGS